MALYLYLAAGLPLLMVHFSVDRFSIGYMKLGLVIQKNFTPSPYYQIYAKSNQNVELTFFEIEALHNRSAILNAGRLQNTPYKLGNAPCDGAFLL